MAKIMMSAANSPVAPSIIKHIKSLGHTVIGHDCNEIGYGARCCDKFIKSPRVGTATFMQWVLTQDFDLYIPFLDEELANIGELSKLRRVACSPIPTLDIFTSKVRQQERLSFCKLPIAEEVSVIVKPERGRGGKGQIRLANLPGAVVQREIVGDEYTVDVMVGLDSWIIETVPRRRIVANGVSLVGKIELDSDCMALAGQIVDCFEFTGPINIQMIREQKTGKLHIIEVNPRLSGSCMFTVRAGFDILDTTIRVFTKMPLNPWTVREATFFRHYEETEL